MGSTYSVKLFYSLLILFYSFLITHLLPLSYTYTPFFPLLLRHSFAFASLVSYFAFDRSNSLRQCVFDGILEHINTQSTPRLSMAESTKRQNNAGGKAPVATPNLGQLVSLETAMSGAIGGK